MERCLTKILIATITAEYKDYCFDNWADNINKFTYPDKKVLIVDNSRNPLYHKKIKDKLPDAEVIYHPVQEGQSIRECMCECNNITRDYFLKGGYAYMLSLESDIFPRKDCIEQLLSHRKAVVGLCYFIWEGCHSKYLNFYIGGYGTDLIAKPMHLDEAFYYMDGSLKEGFNFGFGCLLIHRSVLEKVKFRINLESSKHIDSFFHEDLKELGLQAYIDTSYIAEHRNYTSWADIYKKERK